MDQSPPAARGAELDLYLALDPPVTKRSLSCLDLATATKRIAWLHDVALSPDAYMRPQTVGVAAKRKQDQANLFWKTLETQLRAFLDPSKRADFVETYGMNGDWCLPRFLQTVTDILDSIVAEPYVQVVREGLDVKRNMQQYYGGNLEVGGMADWLSGLLTAQCAPMRDEQAYRMGELIRAGNEEGNVRKLVEGLRELLALLESMKLDIVNNCIMGDRPRIIHEIVRLERHYFADEISSGRMRIHDAKDWYSWTRYHGGMQRYSCNELDVFFQGLSRLVLPSSDSAIPGNFVHDHNNLMRVRKEILDAVNIDVCIRIFQGLEDGNLTLRIACGQRDASELLKFLSNLLPTLSSEPSKSWQSLAPLIAAEMGRCLGHDGQEQTRAAEARLRDSLCQYNSDTFQQAERDFHQRFLEKILIKVRDCQRASASTYYHSQLEMELRLKRSRDPRDEECADRTDGLANRIAHIGLLHWAVWSDRVYGGD